MAVLIIALAHRSVKWRGGERGSLSHLSITKSRHHRAREEGWERLEAQLWSSGRSKRKRAPPRLTNSLDHREQRVWLNKIENEKDVVKRRAESWVKDAMIPSLLWPAGNVGYFWLKKIIFIDTVFILPIACKLPRGCLFSMLDSCEKWHGVCQGSGLGLVYWMSTGIYLSR